MRRRRRFRHGYHTASLPLSDREDANPEVLDAMRDEGSHVDEAVPSVDFDEWLATLDDRRREGRLGGVIRVALPCHDGLPIHGHPD